MQQFHRKFQKNKIDLKQYVYRIGSYHYNWHRELEIMVLLAGEIEVATSGDKRILRPGDVIVINSNQGHATLAHEPDSIAMVLHVDPKFFTDYYDQVDYLEFLCCSAGRDPDTAVFQAIRRRLAWMMLQLELDTPEKKLRYEREFFSLIHEIVEQFPPRQIQASAYQSNKKRLDAIESLIRFIDKNYRRRITLEDLASFSNYNPTYLSQLFKSQLGINFNDYLTRIRLREATYELGQTDHTISAVAQAHGFSDVKAFNAVFKANFGSTPSDYRKRLTRDITRVDSTFKREFLPVEDPRITKILQGYLESKTTQSKLCLESDQLAVAAEALQWMRRLTLTLHDATDHLGEAIRSLGILIEPAAAAEPAAEPGSVDSTGIHDPEEYSPSD